ncbi:hypothetical protein VNO78_10617 [Psophocarpus tetragonolobus]|uniref:DUF4283 domain-containing protein n=1 Tax=Psophocarpus tetragonolobus TaxID=3891 RepID=A0AAN9SME6_PSOTE
MATPSRSMSGINMERLTIIEEEEDGLVFHIEEEKEKTINFNLCMVGRFLNDRTIRFQPMKERMMFVRCPGHGVTIIEAEISLFLFQFSHHIDLNCVFDDGPWSFHIHTLVMGRAKPRPKLKAETRCSSNPSATNDSKRKRLTWTSRIPLNGLQNIMVKDLIDHDKGSWNLNLLDYILPFKEVLCVSPVLHGDIDTLVWHWSKSRVILSKLLIMVFGIF